MKFEEKLKRLEVIVSEMEKPDVSLEDSLRLYEEGIKLSTDCQKDLIKAEEQVRVLAEGLMSSNGGDPADVVS